MGLRVIALSVVIVLMLPVQTARPADPKKSVTIRLISETTSSKVLTDRAPTGKTSKGDVWRVTSELRNAVAQFGRSKGAIVGHETIIFKYRGTTSLADMTVQSELPGGGLVGRGLRVRLGPTPTLTYRILGGTGSLKGASGTGKSVPIGERGHLRSLLYGLVFG